MSDESKKNIDSHIQMPKLVLRRFVDEDKQFFYYDFVQKKIIRGRPESLNTEFGYYSKRGDDYLNVCIEDKFGKLLNIIDDNSFPNGKELPQNHGEVVAKYVCGLIARSPAWHKELCKEECYNRILSVQEIHDIAVIGAFRRVRRKNLFGEYKVTVLVNKTDEEWILPNGGLISEGLDLICPVSPTKAFKFQTWMPQKNNTCNTNIICEINDSSYIHDVNKKAIEQEMIRDAMYVVSRDKKYLRTLLLEMNIHVELESLYVNSD